MDCAIIGDSIAVGIAQQRFNCTVDARVGLSSSAIVRIVGDGDLIVISAGSNDPNNPKLISNLEAIRSKRTGKVIWIIPVHPVAAASVRLVAQKHQDMVVSFKPGKDGVHPKSYKALAGYIRAFID